MYRALANGEKIPAGMSRVERREMLKRLELERLSRKYIAEQTRKSQKPSKVMLRSRPQKPTVTAPIVVCDDGERWKREVERVMNLPYGQRWEFSSKWNQTERNYAKSIELKRIGCGLSGWD